MGDYTDILYCCGTDYIFDNPENIKWFENINKLKTEKTCWKECGIVEIILIENDIIFPKWIIKGSLNES